MSDTEAEPTKHPKRRGTEKRTYRISKKRFSRKDLEALAAMVATIAQDVGTERVTFTIATRDGITYESPDVSRFEADSAVDLKPISVVSYALHSFDPDRNVGLELSHGDSKYGSRLTVSGDSQEWVHATFSRLVERLEAVEPSESWFTRHPVLLYNLAALSVGTIWVRGLGFLVALILEALAPKAAIISAINSIPPNIASVLALVFGTPVNLFIFWLLGTGWASEIRRWVLAAWPSIDLDVGPESKRRPRQRRERIAVLLSAVVAIACSVAYDFLRAVLK